jgi:hypothetical protein
MPYIDGACAGVLDEGSEEAERGFETKTLVWFWGEPGGVLPIVARATKRRGGVGSRLSRSSAVL